MSISLNAIYKQAIAEYVEKQEIKKWERSVDLALQNKEYLKSCEEAGEILKIDLINIHQTVIKTLNPLYEIN